MKRIQKIRLIENLNSEELKNLKGRGDDYNKNTVLKCMCTYYDAPSVINNNTVSGCSCQCVGY